MNFNGHIYEFEPGEMESIFKKTLLEWAVQRPDLATIMTESDGFMLGAAIRKRLVVTGFVGASDIQRAIDSFGANGSYCGVTGKLTFQIDGLPAATSVQEFKYPHDDLKELKNIRTFADVSRLKKDPALLKRLAHLRPESPAFKEINERMAFIIENNITGEDSLGTTSEKTELDEGYKALRSRVSRITPRDGGETTSSAQSGGAWWRVNRLKERLNEMIGLNEKRGVAADLVDAEITKELDRFSSSSVR